MAGIGQRLRARRESADLSQQSLAKALGKSQAWVSYVELGHMVPSQEEIKAIENAIAELACRQADKLRAQFAGGLTAATA